MRGQIKEDEPLCKDCKAFVAAGKRGMLQFPDGRFYLVTGRCGSEQSQLNGKDLAGAFTASTNAVHHKLVNITTRITCFVRKT